MNDEQLSERMDLRISPQLKRRVAVRCAETGVKLSTFLRRALELWVDGWDPFAQPGTDRTQGDDR